MAPLMMGAVVLPAVGALQRPFKAVGEPEPAPQTTGLLLGSRSGNLPESTLECPGGRARTAA